MTAASRTGRTAGSSSPLRVPVDADPQTVALFSARDSGSAGGGNLSWVVGPGDVASARARVAAEVGVDPDRLVFMEQVHGAGVAVVGRADRGRGLHDHADAVSGADALVCFSEDVACVVLVADCVPVLLVDPGRGVAAVHAGRAGVAAGVVGATLEVLDPREPAAVLAALGPAIGPCCYEVPEELAAEVDARVPGARARTSWGTPSLDLPGAVLTQLRAAGVEQVWRARVCTRCAADAYFSHRADPLAGRQAGIVCRRSTGAVHSGPGRPTSRRPAALGDGAVPPLPRRTGRLP